MTRWSPSRQSTTQLLPTLVPSPSLAQLPSVSTTQFITPKTKSNRPATKRELVDDSSAITTKKFSSSLSSVEDVSDHPPIAIPDSMVSKRSDPPASSSSPTGASAFTQAFRYCNKNSSPFVVQMQSSSDFLFPYPLHITKTIANFSKGNSRN